MSSYIAPEYMAIENMLKPFVKEHELDMVTVNSLIRGSMELLEPEPPTASVAILDSKDMSSAVSVKPSNIRINLKFAFNSIFSFKSLLDAEGIWLVLSLLKTIVFLISDMEVRLNENEAVVLFCLYRLRNAACEEMIDYIETVKSEKIHVEINTIGLKKALYQLEKIGTVKLEAGKYSMCETILIRKH